MPDPRPSLRSAVLLAVGLVALLVGLTCLFYAPRPHPTRAGVDAYWHSTR